MVSFENDYNVGGHPEILDALVASNYERQPGYGDDRFTLSAIDKIRKAANCPQAQITFLTGGTQTNQLVISTMTDTFEGVICAKTGHIALHEAMAIEYAGRKVIELEAFNGKLQADDIEKCVKAYESDDFNAHMTRPAMVYISQPTELGTLYSRAELEAISQVCQQHRLILYVDGARLATALASHDNDVSLSDLARIADVFYIGGAKCGALFGEALVFTKNNQPSHFLTRVKQRGALLAKGRNLGVQFEAMFTNNLYGRIGQHIIEKAEKLKELLHEAGCTFFFESPTNQQFIIVEDAKLPAFSEKIAYSFWEKCDDTHTVIRLVTSWATTDEDLEELRAALKILKKQR